MICYSEKFDFENLNYSWGRRCSENTTRRRLVFENYGTEELSRNVGNQHSTYSALTQSWGLRNTVVEVWGLTCIGCGRNWWHNLHLNFTKSSNAGEDIFIPIYTENFVYSTQIRKCLIFFKTSLSDDLHHKQYIFISENIS